MTVRSLRTFYERRNEIIALWAQIEAAIDNPAVTLDESLRLYSLVETWIDWFEGELKLLNIERHPDTAMMLETLVELLEGVEGTAHMLLNRKSGS